MGQEAHDSFTGLHSSDLHGALHLSQQAPRILSKQTSSPSVFTSVLGVCGEKSEQYQTIEQLMLACLRTGDDESARLCLDELNRRFGSSDDRVMGLRSVYKEAIAKDETDLEQCLHECEKILAGNPVNVPILKRRVAILRSLSRPIDAISALTEFLEAMPTDAEAWCELADLYLSQGMSQQAIFSLEEALLIAPFSWNLHARAGELQYICACSSRDEMRYKSLVKSVRYFCRSIELCDDYLRGFYGLVLASSNLLEDSYFKSFSGSSSAKTSQFLSRDTIQRLNAFSIERLGKIIKERSLRHEEGEQQQGELIAAKELLNSKAST